MKNTTKFFAIALLFATSATHASQGSAQQQTLLAYILGVAEQGAIAFAGNSSSALVLGGFKNVITSPVVQRSVTARQDIGDTVLITAVGEVSPLIHL